MTNGLKAIERIPVGFTSKADPRREDVMIGTEGNSA